MTKDPDRLYCRWCNFSVLKYRTNKKGEKVPGWGALADHQEVYHPAEFEQNFLTSREASRHDPDQG